MSYQFEFEKRSLLALGIGALLLGVVLFFAGFFTEMLIAGQTPSAATRTFSPAKKPTIVASTAEGASTPKAPPPAPAAVSALTPSTAASSATALQLAVRVGIFTEPAKAKDVAEQLQKQGFSPVIASQVGTGNQQISIVEVGPFSAWEQASQVAQLIAGSLGVRPAIRPML